ncbi:class I SAM-dependent methyltransferase [Aquiflexum sp. TKW24L]|uniref:class I SAM-dependent methyltransferase n=1 Tax=Aquiflexum sp. TKW24L TaxID=2942212 RepID=UPI0020BDAD86|nr:class I SAM-dependent methyltransferase [Aquiflexum sp. TKW24L]MCL6258956.1 class I SAM-dependent methyltransferase [Aquiflexum sp. TKW24L]
MKVERNKACLACGNEKNNTTFVAQEKMLGLGGSFEYLNCDACKSIQLVDIPADMDAYYPSNYYAFGNLVESHGLMNVVKKLRKTLFDRNLWVFGYPEYYKWLAPIEIEKDASIADIGCGNGQLVYELKWAGFKNLYGFDPYLPEEKSMEGLRLERKDVYKVSGQYDLVMLHHSFEHMENPVQVMEKLNTILKKGGKLLIRVPVTDAEVWKQEKTDWFQIDAPRHFFIPSKNAMKILGEKCGLKLTQVIFDSNEFQFIITDMYKNNQPMIGNNPNKSVNRETRVKLQQKAKILNATDQGDQACFYFEKA